MKQYLLIDIGGTFIKYSLADEQARKISGGKVPTPLTNMDDLLAAIEGFAAPLQGQFVGCAISMPGRIDTRNGIAHTGGMLSTFMWEQPFAAQVEARLGVPVTIANDGKCAAAAEGWTGALAGVENGLVLVLGTGIGGGIYYLAGTGQYVIEKSILGMGFNGIPVALLASSNPIGTIFSAIFISHISVGGSFLSTKYYPTEISDLISGIIIYLCAFSMLFRGKIQSLLFRNAEKTNVNAEPAPAAEKTKKEGK